MMTYFIFLRCQLQTCKSHLATLKSSDSGSVAIETALAYMLMMNCVLGIIALATMAYTYSIYQEAARYGVRYATVHGSHSSNCSGPTSGCGDQTAAHVVTLVKSYASPFTAPIASTTVQVSYPDAGGCTAPSRVIVTVNYTYTSLFNVIPNGIAFQVSSQGRIIY